MRFFFRYLGHAACCHPEVYKNSCCVNPPWLGWVSSTDFAPGCFHGKQPIPTQDPSLKHCKLDCQRSWFEPGPWVTHHGLMYLYLGKTRKLQQDGIGFHQNKTSMKLVSFRFYWERKIVLTNQTSHLGAWEKVLVVVVGNIQLETCYQVPNRVLRRINQTKSPSNHSLKKNHPEVNLYSL